MKSLLINILCPLICCQNIFVLSLNRNNFRTVVLGILVLMSLLSCFTRCGRSILVPSILSFGAIISWTFSSLPFYVSPLSLSSHQSLYFFSRDLSSSSVSLFWTYFGSIWFSYISWTSLSSFPRFFLR